VIGVACRQFFLENHSDAILSPAGYSSRFYRHLAQFKSGTHCNVAIIDAFLKSMAVGTSLVNIVIQIREKGGENYEDHNLIFGSPDSSRESRSE
jgi:hypothetical protein